MSQVEIETLTVEIKADEVELQLARLLDSHLFRHSSRYPALLRFLVEQTQLGKAHLLKERLLGIEVFHRAPDYDTNSEPVVRVTAAEVRKRIAQYYQEPGHEHELRIEIPIGSYVPRFHRPPGAPAVLAPPEAPAPATAGEASVLDPAGAPSAPAHPADAASVTSSTSAAARPARSFWSARWRLALVCLLAGGLMAWAALRLPALLAARREHAARDLWNPLKEGDAPLFIVVGDHTIGMRGNALRAEQGSPANASEAVLQMMNEREQITFSDVASLFKLTNYMALRDVPYHAKGAGGVDLAELRNGPVLLFAGLDNRWTMRLADRLRFHFVDSPDDTIGLIEDAQVPGRGWKVDFKVPATRLPGDYALVARYFDPTIEQPVMIVAGVGVTGTVAAAEFVTSERMIEDLDRLAPKGWAPATGNVELVLAVQVIDGHPGPPHIVASQFW